VRRSTPGTAALGACWRGELMSSGYCRHALACSRGLASCREAEGKERGSGLFLLLSSGSHGRGPGRGDGESTDGERGMSTGTATRARAYEDAIINSDSNFPDFCPQGVRHNVRKKQSFEF
jgi:hypothetical protein